MSSPATNAPEAPERRTRLHIVLHWLVLALIVVQFALGDRMSELFRQTIVDGLPGAPATFLGLLHMVVGITVFIAIAARLQDRFTNGRPAHPPGEPDWAQTLARITQTLLYATVLAMPVAGLVTWFTQALWLASAHAIASKVLLALITLHVAGALADKYWFKADVFDKMLPGHGRGDNALRQERPRRDGSPRTFPRTL